MADPPGKDPTRPLSAPLSKALSGRSSPLSSDFEEIGREEARSMTSARSGVLVDIPAEGCTTNDEDDTSRQDITAAREEPLTLTAAASAQLPPRHAAMARNGTRSGGGSQGGKALDDPVYNTLRELEDAGHKVADFAKATASDVSRKSKSELQACFALPDTEQLLERFACTLAQSYRCSNNHFTNPRQVKYPGKLYITDHNSCFKSDVEETTLILPHSDVTAIEKLPTSLGGGDTGGLKISFGDESEFILFRAFGGPSEGLDSALALLEHLSAPDG